MTTNPYIVNETLQIETDLINELVVEAIAFYGVDTVYLPRKHTEVDSVVNETTIATYDTARTIECYLENTESFLTTDFKSLAYGFQLEGSGLEISLAVIRFEEIFGPLDILAPMKGDRLYIKQLNFMATVTDVKRPDEYKSAGGAKFYRLVLKPYTNSHDDVSEDYDGEMSEIAYEGVNILDKFAQADTSAAILDAFGDTSDADDAAKTALQAENPLALNKTLDDFQETVILDRPGEDE